MGKIKKIYLSIPITGRDIKTVKAQAKAMVSAIHGKFMCQVINPLDVSEKYPNLTWEEYMAIDLMLLSECDGVCLCEGWKASKGCRLEEAFARTYGTPLKMLIYDGHPQIEFSDTYDVRFNLTYSYIVNIGQN